VRVRPVSSRFIGAEHEPFGLDQATAQGGRGLLISAGKVVLTGLPNFSDLEPAVKIEPLASGTESLLTLRWSKPDSNSRSHPLTRRQTHGSDRMNGAERDTVVGSGSLVTLDPGAIKP
jgi:hypothetical protein